jgi:hypothetical protein
MKKQQTKISPKERSLYLAEQRVFLYPSKYKAGLLSSEIDELLKEFPGINMDKYNDAMMGHTCSVIDGNLVMYRHDVALALRCGLENRSMRHDEWD